MAAATFARHLDALWAGGRPSTLGWRRRPIDELQTLVELPSRRADSPVEPYYILLGAEYYDSFPPTVAFVDPSSLSLALSGSPWLPTVSGSPWFAIHTPYSGAQTHLEQLVCFSFGAEYYMVDHAPPPGAVWKQGRHTVSATLSRLAEVLSPPYYQGSQGARSAVGAGDREAA